MKKLIILSVVLVAGLQTHLEPPWPGCDRTKHSLQALSERIKALEEWREIQIDERRELEKWYGHKDPVLEECRESQEFVNISPAEIGTSVSHSISSSDLTIGLDKIKICDGSMHSIKDVTDGQIKELAESGRICEVIGHKWQFAGSEHTQAGLEGKTVSASEDRECVICGKDQRKEWIEGHWSEWVTSAGRLKVAELTDWE